MSKEVKRWKRKQLDLMHPEHEVVDANDHGAAVAALLAERDELKRDVEILEREVKECAGFLLLLNAVRYRLRREVGDEAFGAARLQRIFLLGYQNAAQLLRILTEKGDLVPAGEGGHQRKFAALQGEQP